MGILKTMGTASDPKLFGANGSAIKSLDFYAISPHARYVIAKIRRQGANKERFWDPLRDGSTVFQNKANDLPAGSIYKEYTVLQVTSSYTMNYAAMSVLPGGVNKGKRKTGRDAIDASAGDWPVFESGMERIVHDESKVAVFYYTPTHYTGEQDGLVYYNPFFLVTGITDQHQAAGPGF